MAAKHLGAQTRAPLAGYTLPLSPSGDLSLVPHPPWHLSGEFIWIEYRCDAAAAAALLPAALQVADDPARAVAAFVSWQWTAANGTTDEWSPARLQFSECFFCLGCTYGDEAVVRVPFAWVDDALALARGWIQGLPKLVGHIAMTRPVRAGRGGPRFASGERFVGRALDHGLLDVRGCVTITAPSSAPPGLASLAPVHTRHVPAWDEAHPPISELVSAASHDHEYANIWEGEARLDFGDCHRDVARVAPLSVSTGFVFEFGETLSSGQRLLSNGGR